MKRLLGFLRARGKTISADYGPRQWVVTLLFAIPLWLVPFLVSSSLWIIAALATKLRTTWDRHVAYPILVAKRFLAGEPLWRPIDLLWDVQPFTKNARMLAEGDQDLVALACGCGKETCTNKQGRYVFLWQVPKLVAENPDLGRQLALGQVVMTRRSDGGAPPADS